MPIQSKRNLYPGINAHLNSLLQHEPGGWQSFHSVHVTHLFEAIDANLPPGYFARSEKTMQINEIIPPPGPRLTSGWTIPDVTVFRARSGVAGGEMAVANATPPARTLLLAENMTTEEYLPGIAIYQAGEGDLLGKPITRIELLSPANKRGGAHHTHYLARRSETFDSQLRLVEIDFLHETPPVIGSLPSYPDREEGSFPYWVIISDPLPTVAKGHADVYDIGVDMALPIIAVPLAGREAMALNLGAVYNQTFASSRFFQMVVDYEQEPVHFDRYTPADQSLIRARMAAVAAEQPVAK